MKIITGNSDQSWECWYKEEIQYLRGLTTSGKVFLVITRCMMWVVMGIGIAGPGIPNKKKVLAVLIFYYNFFWKFFGKKITTTKLYPELSPELSPELYPELYPELSPVSVIKSTLTLPANIYILYIIYIYINHLHCLSIGFIANGTEREKFSAVFVILAVFYFGNWILTKSERTLSYPFRRCLKYPKLSQFNPNLSQFII